MNSQIQVVQAFNSYKSSMDKIYFEISSLKESYSPQEYGLLIEGFLDYMKQKADSAGEFIGSTVKNTKAFISTAWDKGIEMGKRAVAVAKNVASKIALAAQSCWDYVAKLPAKIWDATMSFLSTVAKQIVDLWNTSVKKGKEAIIAAKNAVVSMLRAAVSGATKAVQAFYNWGLKNAKEFGDWVKGIYGKFVAGLKAAMNSTIQFIKDFATMASKVIRTLAYGAEQVALFALGCIILAIQGFFDLVKGIAELVVTLVKGIGNIIMEIIKGIGQIYEAFKRGYNKGAGTIPKDANIGVKPAGKGTVPAKPAAKAPAPVKPADKAPVPVKPTTEAPVPVTKAPTPIKDGYIYKTFESYNNK